MWTEKGKEVIKEVLREKPERDDGGGRERDKRGSKGDVKKGGEVWDQECEKRKRRVRKELKKSGEERKGVEREI